MKTKEELNVLRNEVETPNAKPTELSKEELMQVTGGEQYEYHMYKDTENKEFTPKFNEP